MLLTKNVASASGAARKILQRGREVTKHDSAWNAKYFEIYCLFVSVSKSPNLALHMLVSLNHN